MVEADVGPLQRGLMRAQALNQQAERSATRMGGAYDAAGRRISATGVIAQKAAGGLRVLERATTLAGKAAAVGLAGGVAYAIKKAADFEQQMSRLKAATEANRREMVLFRAQALKAGAATKYSALEAAKAQTELAKGGLSVKRIMGGGLKAALALAAAGEMDLADASKTTVNAMKLFGLRGRDSMKVADALATAANRTTADVSDFALALKQGGSVAKLAGLSFNDTVVALEALAEAGIKGSDAGTSLKSFFVNIGTPSMKAANAMDALGMSIFDSQGKLKSLPGIAANLRHAFGDLTKEEFLNSAGVIAGSDAVRTLYSIYDAGPQKLRRLAKATEEQGTAAKNAKTKQDNLKGATENLHGSIETLAITSGTKLLPALTDGAKVLTRWVNDVNKIAQRDDLDLGQKIKLSMDAAEKELGPSLDKIGKLIQSADLPEKLAAGLSKAVPFIAEQAAKAAPRAAHAFFEAWRDSNIWAKLVIGGWLLHKLGGLSAFRALGMKAGGAVSTGMAGGIAAGAPAIAASTRTSYLAAAGAATGTGKGTPFDPSMWRQYGTRPTKKIGGAVPGAAGRATPEQFGAAYPGGRFAMPESQLGEKAYGSKRLTQSIRGAASQAAPGVRAVGKGVLGVALFSGIADAATSSRLNLGERVQRAASTTTLGLIPDARDIDERMSTIVERIKTWRGKALALNNGDPNTSLIRQSDLDDFSTKEKAMLSKLASLQNAANEFNSKFHIRLDAEQINPKLREVETGFDRFRNHTTAGVEDVQRQVARNSKLIAQSLGKNTADGRAAARKNLTLAVQDIQNLVHSGIVTTKNGAAAIRKLMVQYLGSFGIKGSVAVNLVGAYSPSEIQNSLSGSTQGTGMRGVNAKPHGQARGGMVGFAKGGTVQFGTPGAAGRDNIPVNFGGQRIVVGAGEQGVVLTRHQQAGLNQMAATHGYRGLQGYLDTENKPNYMARGGTIPRQKVAGPGPIAAMSQRALDVVRAGAQRKVNKQKAKWEAAQAMAGGETSTTGLVSQVKRALAWARKHGWSGQVTSGFRSDAEQVRIWNSGVRPAAKPKALGGPGSNHSSGQAIDVSDWQAFAAAMASAPPNAKLLSLVDNDPVHFSVTGHARGGMLDHFARGGTVGKGRPKSKWGQGVDDKELKSVTAAIGRQMTALGAPGITPRIVVGELAGKNSYAEYWPDGIHVGEPMARALAKPGSRNHSAALKALVHEMVHARQRPGLNRNEREGGAEGWALNHSSQIFRKLGLNFSMFDDGTYLKERTWLAKHRDGKWINGGQFDYGTSVFATRAGRVAATKRGGGLGSLNQIFPEHGLNETAGKKFISFDGWRRIFEAKGASPADAYKFATIARGEGGGGRMGAYPGIRGDDPGGTKGWGGVQLTPETWDPNSTTYKLMMKLGGVAALRNPFVQAAVAMSLKDEGGWGNWNGTKYMSDAPAGTTSALTKGDRRWMKSGGMKAGAKPAPSGKVLAGYQRSYTQKSQRLAWVNEQLERPDLKKAKREKLTSERKNLKGDLRDLKGKLGELTPTKGRSGLSYEEQMSVVDRQLAKAETTTRKSDDVKVQSRRLELLRKRQVDKQKRLGKINQALKGKLPKGTRQRLLGERSGLMQELASIPGEANTSIQALMESGPAGQKAAKGFAKQFKLGLSGAPTAMDFAQSKLAQAGLTAGKDDDISALTEIRDLAQKQYDQAVKAGDPKDIADAAGSLQQATEDLAAAIPKVTDFMDADLIKAQVLTPNDLTDDKGVLTRQLDYWTGKFNEALQTADPFDDIEAGGHILELRDAIKGLDSTIDQAAKEKADLDKQMADNATRLIRLAETQGPAMTAAIGMMANGSIGGLSGLARLTPSFPGSRGLSRS